MVAVTNPMEKNNRFAVLSKNITEVHPYVFINDNWICYLTFRHVFLNLTFQAEYDAMLLEFAGEGIPLVAAAVPADNFAPFLNDLLPLIMRKAVSV